MLSAQGPAQDPNFIPVLIALAVVLIYGGGSPSS